MDSSVITRKLTAILSADVVGYSRLMRDDEEATILTLKKYKELIFELIQRHYGRLVDSPGDNVLAEFSSIVDAVVCAVRIQNELKASNDGLPSHRKMEFRIGINIGDVIQDGDRIYGDGVNITARIESLAEPGGIGISRTAYDQVKNKINIGYDYLGEYEVKNIDEPVRVYKVLMESISDDVLEKEKSKNPASGKIKISSPSEKPSIAVLPFLNLSSDPEQEYFVDGLTEEILNSLTQIPDLTVIARTSSFSFKNTKKTIQEISSVLGVENILEGSVRKAGNALRITTQLVKVVDGSHLWSETYDRELTVKEIFAVQENIATSVADELKVTLGIGKSLKQVGGTDNLEAYELFLVAREHSNNDDFNQALEAVDVAISLDSKFALAWALKARNHMQLSFSGSFSRSGNELDAALIASKKAIELDPNIPEGFIESGRYESLIGNWIDAELNYRKALLLRPEKISPYGMAHTYNMAGYFKKSQEILEEYRRSDPLNLEVRSTYITFLGLLRGTQAIENENKRCKALFGDLWKARSWAIAYHRLGTGNFFSGDEIEYSSPIFIAVKECLNSPGEGLAKLRQLYNDENNLSEIDITDITILAAYLGDPEFAMDAMQKGCAINAAGLFKIWYPVMKEVRQLPRFKEFVREIGLVDYWKKFGWPDLCHPVDDDDFVCE